MASIPSPSDPGLRLAAVRIQDFRSIKDLVLSLGQVTVLVGENNAGKSSILEALAIGLGAHRATTVDLRLGPSGERAERFVIDLRIEPAQGEEFDQDFREIVGTAIQLPDDGAEFVVLRVIGEPSIIPGRIDEQRRFLQGWAEPRAEAELLVPVAALVPRAWSDRVLFQLLDARRDLAADLVSRGSFWGRMAGEPRLPAELAAEVQSTLAALGTRIAAGSPVLEELRKALQLVVDTATKGEVELAPLPTEPDELARGLDVLVRAPGSAAIPVGRQGSGTRSLAALMVFRAYVVFQRARAVGSPLIVTALEEIEAHLHPQAARTVGPLLRELPGQTLLSTHSPYVIDRVNLSEIRTVHRRGAEVTLGTISGLSSAQLEDARRWVQRHKSELLFARLVLLVEGDAEETMIEPLAAARWACPPGQRGVSIVNVAGAQNFKHFVTVLEALGIAWVILADGDQEGVSGVSKTGEAIGRALSAASTEITMLPQGSAIESYLVDEGFSGELESAIARVHGAEALDDWRQMNHGQPASKGKPARDYQSAGWEKRLLIDFLVRHKTGWGQAFALACIGTGAPRIPTLLDDAISSADARLSQGAT